MSRPFLITFTPATDPSDLWKDGQQQPQPEEPESTLDGAAARAFYEALIGDESCVPDSQRSQTEPARERKRKKRRIMGAAAAEAVAEGVSGRYGQGRSLEAEDKMTHRILRAAQEGDLAELRRLLEPHEAGGAGGNINARDAFWWTPLMSPTPSLQYCETCDTHFQDSNHRTSTAHLLSLSQGPQPSSLPLGVPISSPGFKLLLRGGWEPGMGLGPRGEGRANPIPTVLKRDQEGLGYRSAPQPRVTHFPAWDTRAVAGRERAPQVATLSRKKERRREEKDRAWERDLRTYMNLEF
ncbi:G patch domain and ankyrin repeat-containing protein 1 isoform X2 [Macaca nemestrina]|uniref:G patch domain and ankyrin repeat-containing protein 1 isoform X2 n=1 Tax=Macaca nemestrina TaxID=9545 RepID=UPI0005F55EBF|nr:G patch domain and ankyrin repeat-containing protein 1 isoform X2 [Macaca nemestrina]